MTNPTFVSSILEKPRRRLFRQYRQLGSWRKLAKELSSLAGFQINHRYPYEYVTKCIIPANKRIQRALGISRLPRPVTINQLLQLPIQDMPTEILRLAFENRQEM